jgi:hypothetical protein
MLGRLEEDRPGEARLGHVRHLEQFRICYNRIRQIRTE